MSPLAMTGIFCGRAKAAKRARTEIAMMVMASLYP